MKAKLNSIFFLVLDILQLQEIIWIRKRTKAIDTFFFHRYPGVIFILAQSFHSPVHLDFGVLKCQVSPHNSWQINRMCLI